MDAGGAVTGAGGTLARRLKLAGLLLSGGLLIEVVTLYWSHPMAFLAFLLLGGLLVGSGILLYLYSLVS